MPRKGIQCEAFPRRGEHSIKGLKAFFTHELGIQGSHKRFDKHSHIFFNQGKKGLFKSNLWFIYPCVYFGFNNHCMVNCWRRQSLQEKLSRKEAEGKCCFPNMENDHKWLKSHEMSNNSCVHVARKAIKGRSVKNSFHNFV